MRGGGEPQVLRFATAEEAAERVREIEKLFHEYGVAFGMRALIGGSLEITADLQIQNLRNPEFNSKLHSLKVYPASRYLLLLLEIESGEK